MATQGRPPLPPQWSNKMGEGEEKPPLLLALQLHYRFLL
jgi:hypothetical protein